MTVKKLLTAILALTLASATMASAGSASDFGFRSAHASTKGSASDFGF